MSISRELFSLAICGVLSVVMIGRVVLWMDENRTLDSQTALIQAKHSLAQFCTKKGMGSCHMILTDASAPVTGKHGWQFEFQLPSVGPVSIEVQDDGNTRLLSHARH